MKNGEDEAMFWEEEGDHEGRRKYLYMTDEMTKTNKEEWEGSSPARDEMRDAFL